MAGKKRRKSTTTSSDDDDNVDESKQHQDNNDHDDDNDGEEGQYDDCEYDDIIVDDDDPFDFASLPAPPHSQPIFEDSRAGRAAWQCEYNNIDRSPQPHPSDSAMRSAYQTLSTIASDYGQSGDDDSSDNDDAWYHTDPDCYDNLDFY